jgi:hypothetical protein
LVTKLFKHFASRFCERRRRAAPYLTPYRKR